MPGSDPGGGIDQWDRYWSFGSLHSFSQVSGGNYGGVIAAFWRERFAALEAGARIVDIATGNGAVPLLALEVADRRGIEFDLHGVDLANIDPAHRVADAGLRGALARCSFHPRTRAEALPFEDASVALVCSQYGLEYSDLPLAVDEIGRVAAPGATVALVVHHHESVLLQAAETELEQLAFVLDEARVWVHARNLLRSLAEAGGRSGGRDRPKVEKKRRALDRAQRQVHEAAGRTANPRMLLGPLNYIHEILAAVDRQPRAKLLDLLEESRQRLLANRRRLLDMRQAACSGDDIEQLAARFRQAGFQIERQGPMREHDDTLLGWELLAARP